MRGETQVVRGTIGDRPWGAILGALGVAKRTAELTVRADGKVYRIAFDRGAVVAASSPVASDAVTRIALTNHHITPSQVNDIKRRVAAAPNQDDVDVLAAAVGLEPDTSRAFRIRVVTQRAARTFAVEHGDYEIEDRMPIPMAGTGIDIRSVIFMGARMNLSDERLRDELRQFGTRFVLKPGAVAELERYDFTTAVRPVLEALRTCTSIAELEASHRDLDPRALQAVVYALASCEALAEIDLSTTGTPATTPVPSDPPPPAVAPIVSITERVRTPTRAPMISRDDINAQRAATATLAPSRVAESRTTTPLEEPTKLREPRQTRSSLAGSRTTTPLDEPTQLRRQTRSSVAGSRTTTPLDETTKVRGPKRAGSPREESAETSFAELNLAEGTPSIDNPSSKSGLALELDPDDDIPFEGPLTRALASLGAEEISRTGPDLDEQVTVTRTGFSRDAHVTISGKPFATEAGSDAVPHPPDRSMIETFRTGKVTTVRPNALKKHEVLELVRELTALLARGADHFTLLGVPFAAPIEDVHTAYVELARNLGPQRLAELGIKDEGLVVHGLLAQIGIAFTVLTDRLRRPEYIATLRATQRKR